MSALSDIRDIFRGVFATLGGFGGRLIARAILMVFAGHSYGAEALGQLGQVAAVSEIAAATCVMGLKRGFLDMLSADELAGRRPETRIVDALCLTLVISIGLSFLLGFFWRGTYPDNPGLTMLLYAAVPAIVFYEVALTATKFKRIVRWDIAARCIAEPWMFLLLTLAFWYMGRPQDGLIIAYVGSVVTTAILAAIGLVSVLGLRALRQSQPSPLHWREIIAKSAPVGVTDIGNMALRRLDFIVLSMFVSAESAGLYYMAQQLVTIPQKIGGLFETMLSPVMAGLHNRKNTGQIRNNLVSVCRWIFNVQLVITVPMIVFSASLMALFGPEFTSGAVALIILLIAELVDGTFLSSETPLIFKKPSIPPFLLVTTLIVEVSAIALLSSVWGVAGGAAGFLIALLWLNSGRILFVWKYLNIALLGVHQLKTLAAGVGMGIAMWMAQTLGPDAAWFKVGAGLTGMVTLGWTIKVFAMNRSDKILLKTLTRRKKRGPTRVTH